MKVLKKSKWILALAVCIALLVSQNLFPVEAAGSSLTSDSIKEKEDQIEQMEKDRKKLEGNLSDLKKMKKELEKQKTNLKNYVAQLDGQLEEIEDNIEQLKLQITAKEAQIVETTNELTEALENEQTQQCAMISRIRLMYESRNTRAMDTLVMMGNFGNFLNSADSIEKVAAYDKQKYEAYKASREYVELCKAQLELEKEILDETKAGV